MAYFCFLQNEGRGASAWRRVDLDVVHDLYRG